MPANASSAPIGPYRVASPALHAYDPRAPEVAVHVRTLIVSRLPVVEVELVGSSSVPGLAGKGIIDLLALYPPGRLEDVKAVLQELGFQRQTHGHIWPEERPMRVGSIDYDGDTFRLHVHVLAMDSPEVDSFRLFRDRLRADPALRDEYVSVKRHIIESGVTDPLAYTTAKGEFCRRVLSEAMADTEVTQHRQSRAG